MLAKVKQKTYDFSETKDGEVEAAIQAEAGSAGGKPAHDGPQNMRRRSMERRNSGASIKSQGQESSKSEKMPEKRKKEEETNRFGKRLGKEEDAAANTRVVDLTKKLENKRERKAFDHSKSRVEADEGSPRTPAVKTSRKETATPGAAKTAPTAADRIDAHDREVLAHMSATLKHIGKDE